MAERKFLFMSDDGWPEEGATTDSITLGSLTMGGNINMNSAGKITNSNAATTNGDTLVYGQNSAALAGLTMSGNIAMGTNKITGVGAGTDDNDVVTRVQLNSIAAGLQVKEAVKATTTAALASFTFAANVLTASANGAFPNQDGIAISLNDRILVKDEAGANEKYNGIYFLSQVGDAGTPWKLTRVTDADTDAEVKTGMTVHVDQGTVHHDQNWTLTTNNPITLNTTALAFTVFSTLADLTGGDGIDISSNTVSVDLATTPGLQFTSNQLDLLLKNANELAKDASGLYVVGVPLQFQLNGVAVGTTVTAANLDDLTDTSNADTLHTHAHSATTGQTVNDHHNQSHVLDGGDHSVSGLTPGDVLTALTASTFGFQSPAVATEAGRVENNYDSATSLALGDPVYLDATVNQVDKGDASVNAKALLVGVSRGTGTSAVPIVSHGPCAGILSGATPGTTYWLAASGGYTTTRPGSNNRIIRLGYAINLTDLFVDIHDFGKKI